MKIVLSRKGFDSSYGGVASPILPDGRMVSLPIPERRGAITTASRTYGQIHAGNVSAGALVHALTRGAIGPQDAAHLDPDLDAGSIRPRPRGWRPAFGQTGAAASHLRNQGVGPGDIFLFFGWFREAVEPMPGRFQWKVGSDDIHACFGYLQIAARWPAVPRSTLPKWLAGHPHHKPVPYGAVDDIYTATDRLNLPGGRVDRPGGGLLGSYQPKYRLTAPGRTRSIWQLPAWFHPLPLVPLTGHTAPQRWVPSATGVLLQTICQGQEFVLDSEQYPQALDWVAEILG